MKKKQIPINQEKKRTQILFMFQTGWSRCVQCRWIIFILWHKMHDFYSNEFVHCNQINNVFPYFDSWTLVKCQMCPVAWCLRPRIFVTIQNKRVFEHLFSWSIMKGTAKNYQKKNRIFWYCDNNWFILTWEQQVNIRTDEFHNDNK